MALVLVRDVGVGVGSFGVGGVSGVGVGVGGVGAVLFGGFCGHVGVCNVVAAGRLCFVFSVFMLLGLVL